MKASCKTSTHAYLLTLALAIASAPAFAETPEERAGARAAARSGVEAYEAGRYSESLDLFTRAEKLVHAPTHMLYIGRCNLKLGRLVRAQEAYQQLIREKLAANAPQPFRDAQATAEEELAAFESKIASVTVSVAGVPDHSQVKVTMDGTPVPSALVGIPFPADPGRHEFLAAADGFTSQPVEKTLAEGGRETIELMLRANGSSASTPATVPATTGSKSAAVVPVQREGVPSHHTSLKLPAYAALGVGVVGIGTGVYFLLGRSSANKEASDAYNACAPGCDDVEKSHIDALDSKAAKRGTLSVVGFVVGGIGVAAGITLLVLDSSRSSSSPPAAVRGWIGPGGVGLSGTF